jgi:hypothetical protein
VIGEPNACIGTSGPNFLVTGTVGAIVTLAVYNCAGVATGATYTVTIVSGGTLIPFSVAAGLGGCGFCVVQVAMGSCTWPVIGGCCADFNTPRMANPMGIEPPIQNETALSLLPNPNKGTFTLSGQFVGVAGKTEVKIEVVDMLGKTIYKENITLENGSINKDITLGDNIPNGVYLVRIKNENVNQVIRFTIDR